MAKDRKVAIIGSGLGSLLCGYILCKEGYDVTILEKHSQIGGCLQSFIRNGCTFDTGAHYIGSMDEGQVLHRYFNYFGLTDKLKLQRLDESGFDRICFGNEKEEYHYAMGYERFVESLSIHFPSERQALVNYVEKLKEVAHNFPLYNLELSSSPNLESRYIRESTQHFLESVTANAKLQNVLAGTNLLYAGIPEKTPMYIHALINNSYIESSWRMVNGTQQMADILSDSIKQMGGKVITSAKVKKFIMVDEKIGSVQLANEEIIDADLFISGIHPAVTLDMIPKEKLRPVYRNRIANLENTISVFTLYIVLKPGAFRYLNYNFYYYKNQNVWAADTYSEINWPEAYLFLTPATSKPDDYADCVTVMAYMKYADVKKWENTGIEKRGDDYSGFKTQKAEKLLDLIGKKFPGFRSKVQSYYTSTPLTYRDYTATKEGSIYGIIKDCNEPLQSFVSPRTKIPNLLFTGQNVNLHGVLGVTIGSVLTCSELLGMEYLINKIKSAS